MTTAVAGAQARENRAAPGTPEDSAQGWYFYGITRCGSLGAVLAPADGEPRVGAGDTAAADDDSPLQLLEFSGLAAVVRPVLLADFSAPALRERLQNAAALEATVRRHNRVIEAIHAQQPILPAKFGMVYTHAEDVVSALRAAHDTLLYRLSRLEACDEWAVHLYADRAVVREQIAADDPAIRRLRGEHAAARPGRAYFLEQQLRDDVEAATQQALLTLAQRAFDRLAAHAVAGQVTSVGLASEVVGETEILRAAFLVARDSTERFQAEVHSDDDSEGLRCESSGPWPAYSFADCDDEEAE